MATVRWIGNAQGVKQVTTIAVSGTWATSDTATLTINDKSVTVTLGTDVSTSNVADVLARAVNGDDDTPGLLNDETRNVNGHEVPEFTEVVASNSGATLTLTSATAGVPFTVTASESTAGTGALGTPTEATPATGPNFVNNADNWEGGSLPADTDTIRADSGSVSMLYGLDYFVTATKNVTLECTTDWNGSIGLPRINAVGYVEYRGRYLQLYGGSGYDVHFLKGSAAATNVGIKRIQFDSAAVYDQLVVDAEALPVNTTPVLEVIGGAVGYLTIAAGNVLIGDPAVSGADLEITTSAIFGRGSGNTTDCFIDLANASISAAEDVTQHSGQVNYRTVMSYTGGGSDTWTINGGIGRYYYSGGTRTLVMNGGVFYPFNHEGPSVVYLYGGAEISYIYFGGAGGNNDYYIAKAGKFTDPNGTITTSDFYTVGCTLSDVTITTAPNGRYTQAAGAAIS